MSGEAPSFDEFKGQLEGLFGQPLTPQAIAAARDFWQSWDAEDSGDTILISA